MKERSEKIRAYLASIDPKIVVFDDLEDAIVGTKYRENLQVPVYDYDKCIDILKSAYSSDPDLVGKDEADRDCALWTMANDWLYTNTIPTIPYLHEYAPYMIQKTESGTIVDILEENVHNFEGLIPLPEIV